MPAINKQVIVGRGEVHVTGEGLLLVCRFGDLQGAILVQEGSKAVAGVAGTVLDDHDRQRRPRRQAAQDCLQGVQTAQ